MTAAPAAPAGALATLRKKPPGGRGIAVHMPAQGARPMAAAWQLAPI